MPLIDRQTRRPAKTKTSSIIHNVYIRQREADGWTQTWTRQKEGRLAEQTGGLSEKARRQRQTDCDRDTEKDAKASPARPTTRDETKVLSSPLTRAPRSASPLAGPRCSKGLCLSSEERTQANVQCCGAGTRAGSSGSSGERLAGRPRSDAGARRAGLPCAPQALPASQAEPDRLHAPRNIAPNWRGGSLVGAPPPDSRPPLAPFAPRDGSRAGASIRYAVCTNRCGPRLNFFSRTQHAAEKERKGRAN